MDRGVDSIGVVVAVGADGWRLDRALADAVPTLSRERCKALISAGHVLGAAAAVRDPATKVKAGTAFTIAVPTSSAGSFWSWLDASAAEFGLEIR